MNLEARFTLSNHRIESVKHLHCSLLFTKKLFQQKWYFNVPGCVIFETITKKKEKWSVCVWGGGGVSVCLLLGMLTAGDFVFNFSSVPVYRDY